MRNLPFIHLAMLVGATLAAACSEPQEEGAKAPRFDAKAIAAQADKGDLAPLAELNKACTKEVEKNGKRLKVCGIQDEVGKLTKPLSVRF